MCSTGRGRRAAVAAQSARICASSCRPGAASPPRRLRPGIRRCGSGGRRPQAGTAPAPHATPAAHEFGDGQRTGPADHQVGPGIGRGHVVDEWLDFGLRLRLRHRRRALRRRALRPPGGASRERCGASRAQRLRHARGSAPRALAAAEHQHAQRACAIGKRARRVGAARRSRRAPGCRPRSPTVPGTCPGSRTAPAREAASRRLVRPGDAVLFVHQQGYAREPRGHPARGRGVTAEGDRRRAGVRGQQIASACQHARASRIKALPEAYHSLAAQAADGTRRGHASLRHRRVSMPPSASPANHRHAARAQFVGDGEAGEDVPAGATGHDHHTWPAAHAVRSREWIRHPARLRSGASRSGLVARTRSTESERRAGHQHATSRRNSSTAASGPWSAARRGSRRSDTIACTDSHSPTPKATLPANGLARCAPCSADAEARARCRRTGRARTPRRAGPVPRPSPRR